jgi:hypothetical protein
MKKYFFNVSFFAGILLFAATSILGQVQAPYWAKIYHLNEMTSANSVQRTTDNGFIIAGYSGTFGRGNQNTWFSKTNGFGDTIWSRVFVGLKGSLANCVREVNSDGYIVAGETFTKYGEVIRDFLAIRVTASGDTIWTRTYGDSVKFGSKHDNTDTVLHTDNFASDVIRTSDGGFVFLGSKLVVLPECPCLSCPPCSSNYNLSRGAWALLIKTDASGHVQWSKQYGKGFSFGSSILQTDDNGFIILGETANSESSSYKIWLVRTNSVGDTLWSRTFGDSLASYGRQIVKTLDGGYAIIGERNGPTGGSQFWLLKTNAGGDTTWTRYYGNGSKVNGSQSLHITSDSGYILTGQNGDSNSNKLWVIRTNSYGDTLWTYIFNGNGISKGNAVDTCSDGSFAVAGFTNYYGNGALDACLLKIGQQGQMRVISKKQIGSNDIYKIRFNRTESNLSFSAAFNLERKSFVGLKLYKYDGKVMLSVAEQQFGVGSHLITFNGSKIAFGSYFVALSINGKSKISKLLIVR